MAEVIVLPTMGLTAEDGQVLRWLVSIGDRVRQGQEVVEVETYKATLAVESPMDGVLRAAIDPGTTVPAGAVIGIIAEPEEPLQGLTLWTGHGGDETASATSDPRDVARESAETDIGGAPAEGGGGANRPRASPLARRLARDLGVELTGLQGSGPRGRITEKDVQAAAAGGFSSTTARPDRHVPLTSMRRAIAKLMTASAQIPQFTLEATAPVSPQAPGQSLSSVVIAACARTLREFPVVNSSYDADALIEHAEINVGVAVALEQGLIVPVMHRADEQTLGDLDCERRRLVEGARSGTLAASDLLGGTFTVSNLGPLRIERFRALVVPPQAAILAVGALRNGHVALSLSCDHRVLDGEPAARFLNRVVERLGQLDWLDG